MRLRGSAAQVALAALIAAARAAGAQAPAYVPDYRGVWFAIGVAGAYTRASCANLCESGSGFSAGYSAALGFALPPRLLVGAEVQYASPFCVDCSADQSPSAVVAAATVRAILAPIPQITGSRTVLPIVRIGWGPYRYESGDADGPAGSASGHAVVGGLALDIPLDSARRRFTRIGSIAPFVSYTRALTGRMREVQPVLVPVVPIRDELSLNVVQVGLGVSWH